MGGTRELKARFTSVGNIKQITRAMEMVATTKLRRFQDRALASRPFTEEITRLIRTLAGVLGEGLDDQPLFSYGEGDTTGVLVIASDRGLCGAYNSNLFRKLEAWNAERDAAGDAGPVRYYAIGRKAYQYLSKTERDVHRYFAEPVLEKMSYATAESNARQLTQDFLSGELRDVHVMFTAFESMASYVPRVFQLLPLVFEESEEENTAGDLIFEPDPETIFETIVPRYVVTRVYNAMLEALTSEFASRRVSMKNATDAASDMQQVLKAQYNRLRQESITTELLDIVGGAEALR